MNSWFSPGMTRLFNIQIMILWIRFRWILFIQRTWTNCCHNTHIFGIWILKWPYLEFEESDNYWETKRCVTSRLKKSWCYSTKYDTQKNVDVTISRVWEKWSLIIGNWKGMKKSWYEVVLGPKKSFMKLLKKNIVHI